MSHEASRDTTALGDDGEQLRSKGAVRLATRCQSSIPNPEPAEPRADATSETAVQSATQSWVGFPCSITLAVFSVVSFGIFVCMSVQVLSILKQHSDVQKAALKAAPDASPRSVTSGDDYDDGNASVPEDGRMTTDILADDPD
ncbi:uncharacterized protein LOC135392738 [Ornithodoros turicata]|uniref:uncharacterized protein LOC135392738 n=1 Tax=Ornithodoros turicata TaxID=34597 RepID=UPI0031393883